MKDFDPRYRYRNDPVDGTLVDMENASPDDFDERILGLGDIRNPSKPFDALAVIFDLENFTDFSGQVDPQLTVPSFIAEFIIWLFSSIRSAFIQNPDTGTLWAELPIFSKFMGDGVLFLWKLDVEKIMEIEPGQPTDRIQFEIQEFICNIITALLDVCSEYKQFYYQVCTRFVSPPRKVRCGIARGTVIPIGHHADYVGSCINIASRLQKFYGGLSFVFSARGIDPVGFSEEYRNLFLKKRSIIRGVGEKELIYILEREFDHLTSDARKHLLDP